MGEEIRNYKANMRVQHDDNVIIEQEVVQAYSLDEALTQLAIKYQDKPYIKLVEIFPFKYIEEQKPVVEQKREVHVKPLPKNLSSMGGNPKWSRFGTPKFPLPDNLDSFGVSKSPDTD